MSKTKTRTLGDWSFDELVDHCAGEILQELIKGNFRSAVYSALELASRWQRAQLQS